jgi:hypothetical protein
LNEFSRIKIFVHQRTTRVSFTGSLISHRNPRAHQVVLKELRDALLNPFFNFFRCLFVSRIAMPITNIKEWLNRELPIFLWVELQCL